MHSVFCITKQTLGPIFWLHSQRQLSQVYYLNELLTNIILCNSKMKENKDIVWV